MQRSISDPNAANVSHWATERVDELHHAAGAVDRVDLDPARAAEYRDRARRLELVDAIASTLPAANGQTSIRLQLTAVLRDALSAVKLDDLDYLTEQLEKTAETSVDAHAIRAFLQGV